MGQKEMTNPLARMLLPSCFGQRMRPSQWQKHETGISIAVISASFYLPVLRWLLVQSPSEGQNPLTTPTREAGAGGQADVQPLAKMRYARFALFAVFLLAIPGLP